MDTVQPGAEIPITLATMLSTGSHDLFLMVDPGRLVSELLEDNNTLTFHLEVYPPLPDLSVSADDISFSPSMPREGESVTIAATVRNSSSIAARNVHVVLREGSSGQGTVILDTFILEVSGHGWATVQTSATFGLGVHTFALEIDPENSIQERSESNNSTTDSVQILTLPDLALSVDDVVVSPASPYADEKVSVAATVRNEGESSADNVRMAYYDGDPSQGGSLLGSEHSISRIYGRSTVRIEKSFFLTPGLHQLFVVADSQGSVMESSEANNHVAIALDIRERPDLAFVGTPTFFPAAPISGQSCEISVVVSNQSASAVADVAVAFYDGDPESGGTLLADPEILATLAAGEVKPVILSHVLAGGFHEIYAVLDLHDWVSESNERNNKVFASLLIGSSLPDLALKSGELTYQPASPEAGSSITLDSIVWNYASNAAQGVVVRWYDGPPETGLLVASQNVNIPASSSVHVTATPVLAAGDHEVHVSVDPDNAVSEANEGNNVRKVKIAVVEAAGWYDDCGNDLNQPHLLQGTNSVLQGFADLAGEVRSVSSHATSVTYRFTGLAPGGIYRLTAVFLEDSGGGRQQKVSVDGTLLHSSFDLPDDKPLALSAILPRDTYQDGTVTVTIDRVAGSSVLVSQLWLTRESGARENAIYRGLDRLGQATMYWNSNVYDAWDGETEAYLLPLAFAAYRANGQTSNPKYQALLNRVLSMQMPDGSWTENTQLTSYALIALVESGLSTESSVIQSGVSWVKRQVNGDGGWGTSKGAVSQPRYTGIVLAALLKCGGSKSESTVVAGVQYLKSKRNSTGYWGGYAGDPDIVWVGPWPLIGLGLATSSSDPAVVSALARYKALVSGSSNFVQPWYDVLRVYYYLGGTSGSIQSAVDILHSRQKSDGGWTEEYDTYNSLYLTFNALEMLGKFGQAGTYETRGMAWVGRQITSSGTYLSTLQELDMTTSALALTAMAKGREYSSQTLSQKTEKTLVDFQQSSGTWSYRFYTSNSWWNEASGIVLEALVASPYVASGEASRITSAMDALAVRQNSDGGWASYYSWASNLVSTNYILRGMIAGGSSVTSSVITKAVAWVLSKRGIDGGWGNVHDTASSARCLLAEGNHAQAAQSAVAWLKNNQNVDGGWGSLLGQTSTVRETALALIALSEAGETGIEVARGVAWLIDAQNTDGSWGAMTLDNSNSNSRTAFALWALSIARYNMGIDLELLFNKPWYYPADLVSMVVNPLNRTVEEVDLSGWVQDQYGSSTPLTVTRGEESFSSEFLIPSDALAGTDTANFSAFSDAAQGAVAGSFVVRSANGVLPDLCLNASDVAFTTDHPQAGATVGIQAVVQNLGIIDAHDVVMRFYQGDPDAGGAAIGDVLVERVVGLGSREVTLEWAAEAGVTAIYVVADPDNGINESAEDNNQASKSIFVNAYVAMPDLSIASGDISLTPTNPYSGEPVMARVNVRNIGDAASTLTLLRFFDADPRVGGQQIGADAQLPALSPGGSTVVDFSHDTTNLSGRLYIYAVADPGNTVAETTESNNQAFSFVELRQPTQPDLVITTDGIVFSSADPVEGDTVTISVTVLNRGSVTSDVEVALYDGDPAAEGTLLVPIQTSAGILGQGVSSTLSFTWSTTGKGGLHHIFAVADPQGKVAEYHEDNNSASADARVHSAQLIVGVTTGQSAFEANTSVPIQLTATNGNQIMTTARLEVEVKDSAGNQVSQVLSQTLDLSPQEVRTMSCSWNTGSNPDGAYSVSAKLVQDGRVVSSASAAFQIMPDRAVSTTVVTDRVSYYPNQTAHLSWRIRSQSLNHDFTGLTAALTVADPSGMTIFTDSRTLASLIRGQVISLDSYWGTAVSPSGSYPLKVQVKEGALVIAESAGSLVIAECADPSILLSGTIAVDRQTVFSGDTETVSYSARNIGNSDLSGINLRVKVVSVDQQTLYAELSDTAALSIGETYFGAQVLSTAGFRAGDYLVMLVGEINGTSATLASTYFRIQGAPSVPAVNSPADGAEVVTYSPTLVVNNATDPNAMDTLTYFFELYADGGLAQLVASAGPIAEGAGTTSWAVPYSLGENTRYWWRCRAYDGWSYGPWITPATFFVNTVNDPPGLPVADRPMDGQEVDTLQPTIVVRNAFDPDEDHLTYNYLVAMDAQMANVVAQTVGVFETAGTTAWRVETPLADNTWFWWTAQADDWLDEGPWMVPVGFFVNTANDAPTSPVPLSPADGEETGAAVTLEVGNAMDPDHDPLMYLFELDGDESFTSGALVSSGQIAEGAGTTLWAAPPTLTENTRYYWRARATDGAADGPWSPVTAFFVNGVNEPPTAPVPANPSDGGEVILFQPELSVHNATDPDGDLLAYDYEVYADATLAALVTSTSGIAEGAAGQTSWTTDIPLAENTRYWWRCRASDGELSGPWMVAVSFIVNTANDAPTAPVLLAPVQGASMDLVQPELVVADAVDPDGDPMTYEFQVFADAGLATLYATAMGVPETAPSTSWTVAPALQDNRQYWWRARAFDGERNGPWMPTASFTVHLAAQSVNATIDFDPNTLNLGSRGTWVTVYIELPSGYDVRSIMPATVKLNGLVPAETKPVGYGDEDRDGIPDAMLKFRRSSVEAILAPGERVIVTVTGMAGAMAFEGIDIIRVTNP